MFGLRRMTHDGTAKVVSCTPNQGWGVSTTDSRGRSTATFDVILDVFPEGAPPFRAETHHRFSPLRHPNPGDSLRARCNPEKQTVEIDISDDERFNPKIFRPENERKLKEEHERLLNAPPGTPAPGQPPADGPSSDPKVDILRVSIRSAERKGDTAEVERLKARLADYERTGDAALPGAAPADSSAGQIDELQKLADLRDRGALTDAEFEAAKAKILDSG